MSDKPLVFVVDDDAHVGLKLANLAKKTLPGAEIVSTRYPGTARAMIEERGLDCLITDVYFENSVPQAAEEIIETALMKNRKAPIIIHSGATEKLQREIRGMNRSNIFIVPGGLDGEHEISRLLQENLGTEEKPLEAGPSVLIINDENDTRAHSKAIVECVFPNADIRDTQYVKGAKQAMAQKMPDILVTDIYGVASDWKTVADMILGAIETDPKIIVVVWTAAARQATNENLFGFEEGDGKPLRNHKSRVIFESSLVESLENARKRLETRVVPAKEEIDAIRGVVKELYEIHTKPGTLGCLKEVACQKLLNASREGGAGAGTLVRSAEAVRNNGEYCLGKGPTAQLQKPCTYSQGSERGASVFCRYHGKGV